MEKLFKQNKTSPETQQKAFDFDDLEEKARWDEGNG
jgi:hypothetical protein